MASLAFRRTALTKVHASGNLRPASTTNVMPCKPGGIATASSSGATITMAAGHGFAVNDKVLINPGSSQVYSAARYVASITNTTIVMDGGAFTVAIGDVIWNLGADTATGSTPNYNAPVTCYTGPSAATTLASANSNNGYAVTNTDGEFQYWHNGGPIWELYLQSSTVIEYDISSGYTMGGQMILSEPSPQATGFGGTLANSRVPLRIFGADTTTPLFSFVPFSSTDTYPILMRVGNRGNTTGDARCLGYFSETLDSPGATESQAVYGIMVYTGSATAVQGGVTGVAQSQPGSGNTITTITSLTGYSLHNPADNLGTTTNMMGVQATSDAIRDGTVTNMYGAYCQTTMNKNTAIGAAHPVYGRIVTYGAWAGTITNACTAKFEQPISTIGTSRCYALWLQRSTADETAKMCFTNAAGTDRVIYHNGTQFYADDGFTATNTYTGTVAGGDCFTMTGESKPEGGTVTAVYGLNSTGVHAPAAGGTTTLLAGALLTGSTSTAGTVTNVEGLRSRVLLSSANPTIGTATGVHGFIQTNSYTGTLTTAQGGRFDMPSVGSARYAACFYSDGSAEPVIGLSPISGSVITIRCGVGSPESAITAPIGSLYLRSDGSTSTTLYVKTSGTGNTGWTAK